MKLKHIEVFNAIMLSGSVSAAARILNVTQPAVTQTLKHAEQQLGYTLFVREKGGMKPTQEARQLHLKSQKIFEQVDELRRLAQSLRHDHLAQFRVAVVPSLSTTCLSRALAVYKSKNPHSTVLIKILHSDEIVRSVALRESDLGIAYGEFDVPSIFSEVIGIGHLLWVERRDPAARHADTTDMPIAEVARRDFIGTDKDDLVGKMLLGLLSESSAFSGTRLSAQT